MNKKIIATAFAILAAALYAINIPFSKLLMDKVDSSCFANNLSGVFFSRIAVAIDNEYCGIFNAVID